MFTAHSALVRLRFNRAATRWWGNARRPTGSNRPESRTRADSQAPPGPTYPSQPSVWIVLSGLDSLLDEAVQLLLGRSADALHTDPSYPRAVFLGGDGYQCFFLRLPSAQSLFCAPHIGLVDLHRDR